MSNKLKVFIIVCVAVFFTGLAATVTGLALHGWRDLDKLPGDWHINEGSGNTKTYTLSGNDAKFQDMDLNVALCEVEFKQGDEYKVEMTYDADMDRPEITIEDDTLVVKTGEEHFISQDGEGFVMVLEITVPKDTVLDKTKLNLDGCQADFSGLNTKTLALSFDLGELDTEMLRFDNATFNLNACEANIEMIGEEADYHFDVTSDLGSVTIGEVDVDSKYSSDRTTPYYYELDADLSDVTVTYQWPSGN